VEGARTARHAATLERRFWSLVHRADAARDAGRIREALLRYEAALRFQGVWRICDEGGTDLEAYWVVEDLVAQGREVLLMRLVVHPRLSYCRTDLLNAACLVLRRVTQGEDLCHCEEGSLCELHVDPADVPVPGKRARRGYLRAIQRLDACELAQAQCVAQAWKESQPTRSPAMSRPVPGQ
jgi:hypothetical protein